MTLIFAPVSFSNSGARRCSGSWIAPVCVMMFTVTPSNSPASAPIDEASANIAPAIAVDMLNNFAMLSFLPISSAPRAAMSLFCGPSSQPRAQAAPARVMVNRLPIDENYTGGLLDASTRHKKGRRGEPLVRRGEINALELGGLENRNHAAATAVCRRRASVKTELMPSSFLGSCFGRSARSGRGLRLGVP